MSPAPAAGWEYGIFPRAGGLGTPVVQSTPTAGILAVIYDRDVACLTSGEVPTPENPVPADMEVVLDLTPMLSVGRLDHTVGGKGNQAAYLAKVANAIRPYNRKLGLKGNKGGVLNDLPEVLSVLKARLALHVAEFGPVLDMAALDAIDLSGYPVLLERFRSSYYSMFETQAAFAVPLWDVVGPAVGGWNYEVLAPLVAELTGPTTTPFWKLERWFWHATACVCIPPLEAAV